MLVLMVVDGDVDFWLPKVGGLGGQKNLQLSKYQLCIAIFLYYLDCLCGIRFRIKF